MYNWFICYEGCPVYYSPGGGSSQVGTLSFIYSCSF